MKYITPVCMLFSLVFLLSSCEKLFQSQKTVYPNPFVGGVGKVELAMNYPKDANGYYLVTLNPNTSFSRFNLYVEASNLIDRYQYNGVSVVEASFDSDTYWVIGPDLTVTLPLYQPFQGYYTSPYFNTPIPVGSTTIVLSQFQGSIVPIVQESGIYLKKYFAGSLYKPADEYKPSDPEKMSWGKRIVGPIPNYMIGDTITIYGKVSWEAGNYTLQHPDETKKTATISIIFN